LVEFLRLELELEKNRLLEKIFYKTLERIFIENRLYKKIETVKTLEGIHTTLIESLKPYRKKLLREPTEVDRDKLLQIPIRRISQFDIDKNREEVEILEELLKKVERHLRNVKKYAIDYLKTLLEKYRDQFPRRTKVKAIEEIDRKAIETKEIKVGFDPETGFIGTKVSGKEQFFCTNFDKILTFSKEGTYKVVNVPEKQYFDKIVHVEVADKKTVINVVYKNKETGLAWGKRFIVDKFILEKEYRYIDEGFELLFISTEADDSVDLHVTGKGGGKVKVEKVFFRDIPIKGHEARGIRLSLHKVRKVS
jgi:topoisomerase-4 subunit A